MAEPVNHKCVQQLMRKMGLRALIRAKKRYRHVPGISDMHAPNVLQRDFCATAPNQKWGAGAKSGGIPIERHRLIDGIVTVQLLGGSSFPGRFRTVIHRIFT